MGGSESRCCTDVPQEKKPVDKRNFAGDSDSEFLAERTRVLQFDPRSPSQVIDRTPIEVPVTPVQTKPLMRVQPMIENNLRNRHVSNENRAPENEVTRCHDTFLVDPRSPGCRTPLSSKQGLTETSISKPSKIVYPESALIDPRSPSQGIVRTPLIAEEEVYESPFADNKGAICETPKKPQGETNQCFTTENDQERDPRSPSQGIDRTPVSKLENPDHHTDVVSARNMHDPRSPTTDVSRTPIGALFAGHRELRRTVLMTNALMASPMNKKIIRQDSVNIEDKDMSEPEAEENAYGCEEDEIPAILCCNFDPLNNSCSSSMVASIGSEVDCISLNESFEGLISTTDTVDVGLMESPWQNINDIALEEEIKEQSRKLDFGSIKFEDVETPTDSSSIFENFGKEWDNGSVDDDCRNVNNSAFAADMFKLATKVNGDEPLKEKILNTDEHAPGIKPQNDGTESLPGCGVEKKPTDKEFEHLAFQNSLCDVPLEGSGDICKNDDTEKIKVPDVPHETELQEPLMNKQKSASSDSEEKQIDAIVSDLVSMADDTQIIKNNSTMENESNKSTYANTELNATSKDKTEEEAFHDIADLAEDFNDVFESCENEQNMESNQFDDKESTKTISSKEESVDKNVETQLLGKLGEPDAKINTASNPASSDKNESTMMATQNQEQDHGSKKPSRKLKSPSKVSNHKKLANKNPTETVQKSSVIGTQVHQSASTRKPSMIRKPKVKSAPSEDGRTKIIGSKSGEGQENMQRSIKILYANRKSDSKLGSTSIRSPLAVLTNELNSPVGKSKISHSPSKSLTKLPRYQGTPPIASNRSLSVSFSGSRSTRRSQSGEKLKSACNDKEN